MKMHVEIVLIIGALSMVQCMPLEKWQKSSDGCPYYIETQQNFNWYQAWEECLTNNMTLLAIESIYEQEQIDGLLKRVIGKNLTFWLAGSDNGLDQRYVWASSGKIFSFTNWASGQPNRQTNDHCIFVHDSTNQWHDFPCATKLGFVCEDRECTQDKNSGFQVRSWKDPKNWNITILNIHSQ